MEHLKPTERTLMKRTPVAEAAPFFGAGVLCGREYRLSSTPGPAERGRPKLSASHAMPRLPRATFEAAAGLARDSAKARGGHV